MEIGLQIFWLFALAIPVACLAWSTTHEELFRELREWFEYRSETSRHLFLRKFFYLFTCEYCFSHYIAFAVVIVTGYRLLLDDWRGFLLAWLSVVWVANVYMGLFGRLRVGIKREHVEIKAKQDPNLITISPDSQRST